MIYLIDDDPAVREALHLLLQTYDLPVTCFVSPADCLAHLDRRRPGILIMDLRMPILNGFETTERLRSLDRPDARTIPIIAMTADAFEEDVKKCLAAGMNGHVPKPIDLAVLYSELEKAISLPITPV